jgi:DNA polymerase
MLDNALRLQYLQVMGIEVWVPRQGKVSDALMVYDQQDSIEPIEQAHSVDAVSCGLCDPVVAVANQQADWLLVVAAPDIDDEMQDLPFEKNAGLLLAEMLRAIDLSVEDVFILPLLACKAVNHDSEAQFCMQHFISQQQLIQPKIILAIGDKAAQALLKTRQPLASLRGQCHYINKTPVVVVEHPAYLLRSLLEKRQAWQDLCFAKQVINNEG